MAGHNAAGAVAEAATAAKVAGAAAKAVGADGAVAGTGPGTLSSRAHSQCVTCAGDVHVPRIVGTCMPGLIWRGWRGF